MIFKVTSISGEFTQGNDESMQRQYTHIASFLFLSSKYVLGILGTGLLFFLQFCMKMF